MTPAAAAYRLLGYLDSSGNGTSRTAHPHQQRRLIGGAAERNEPTMKDGPHCHGP